MGTMIARSISVVSMAGTRARSGQPETCCRAAHPTISLAFKVPRSLAAGRAKAGYRAPLRRVLRSSMGWSCHSRVTKGEWTGRQRQALGPPASPPPVHCSFSLDPEARFIRTKFDRLLVRRMHEDGWA
jgi:hypothetical protein